MKRQRDGTLLDGFLPDWQFHEHHETSIAAPPSRVFRELRAVRADEILFFKTLTWLRRFGQPGPESILNAPADEPLIDVALRTGFVLLGEEPDREIVIGTLVIAPRGRRTPCAPRPDEFRALSGPGFAKAAMNFRLQPEPGGTRLSTETRVMATDARSRRRFAAYWGLIYPGSALIRRMWLRAVRLRAERPAS